MKKICICVAFTAVSLVTAVTINNIRQLDDCFEANVEALARGENGGTCTGPKHFSIRIRGQIIYAFYNQILGIY